jgi:hypothetical protein
MTNCAGIESDQAEMIERMKAGGHILVTISAIADKGVSSGEGVLLKLNKVEFSHFLDSRPSLRRGRLCAGMTIKQLITDRNHRRHTRGGGYPVFEITFYDFIKFLFRSDWTLAARGGAHMKLRQNGIVS